MDNLNQREILGLLHRVSEGDVCAEEMLISGFTRLVRICARPYFLVGGDSEDLIQEGMLGLLSAIRSFNPQKNVQFSTYAEACIRRRLYSAIRSAQSFKHSPLNNYISLESPQLDESNTQSLYFLRDPEEFVLARERVGEISDMLYGSLSKFETDVLGLYLEGMSYDSMAVRLKRTGKSVDNAVQRIRRKLSQVLKNGDNQ